MTSLQNLLAKCSILAKIQGAFPFKISENGEISMLKLWLFWSVIIHAIQIFGAYYLIFIFNYPYHFQNKIAEWFFKCQAIALQLSLEIHFISILFNKQILIKAIKTLIEISKDVTIKFNCKIYFWYHYLLPVILFIWMLTQCFLPDPPIDNVPNRIRVTTRYLFGLTSNYLQGIFNCTAVILFTDLLLIYRAVFKGITASIKEKLLFGGFEKLLDNHDRLISSCEEVNRCFGSLLLISLLTYFEIVMSNFYFIFCQSSVAGNLITAIIWAFVFLELSRLLAYYSTITTDAANEFYNELLRVAITENHYDHQVCTS
ncbi:hypothetical protein O3M35_012687 [Rhynocoris fuscipes]|uniref:Gustatory receptor n=1 Tax=Rhynocoris fuscipes TaxID=488301 RepID=A0AAW1D0K4_9HEMI